MSSCVKKCLVKCRIRRSLFVLLFIYLVVSVIIMPYVGSHLTFSVYYSAEHAQDLKKVNERNQQRLNEARKILQEYARAGNFTNQAPLPEFCFAIPTVSRPNHYLTQLVASLIPQINPASSVLKIFNAEGAHHTEAKNLSQIVPVEVIPKHSAIRDIFTKETRDYGYALEWCYKQAAKYSIIIEDDVLLPRDFVTKLRFVLHYRMPSDRTHWAFLKLYYPEKWESWISGVRIVVEFIVATIMGGLIFSSLFCAILFLLSKSSLSKKEITILFFFSSVFVLHALVAIGRPHLLSLRDYSPYLSVVVPAPKGSTAAVVYPQLHIFNLVQYFKHVDSYRSFPIDFALDKFAMDRNLDRLLVVPNLVKHIGFVSTLRGSRIGNPREFTIT